MRNGLHLNSESVDSFASPLAPSCLSPPELKITCNSSCAYIHRSLVGTGARKVEAEIAVVRFRRRFSATGRQCYNLCI